jgi:hypothetical protein
LQISSKFSVHILKHFLTLNLFSFKVALKFYFLQELCQWH